ncbi:tandem-95 repeat protein [Massilia sp. H-1]|nr:tandem-95 repeat protein [Massilia sp. H-1]
MPVSSTDTVAASEDTPLTITPATLTGNDVDADGDPLAISSVQDAVNGTVAIVGGNVVFTPNANYNGPASFTYTVADGHGGTSTATVNVNVSAVNDVPVAVADQVGGTEDTPLTIPLPPCSATTPTPTAIRSPSAACRTPINGTVAIVGGNVVFTPDANYHGPASFSYTVTDGQGGSATTTVNLDIAAVNDAAVITPVTQALTETNAPLTAAGTVAISDADSPAAFVAGTQTGAYGSLTIDAIKQLGLHRQLRP